MDKILEFINNPANNKDIYFLFVLIGLGILFNTIKKVIDEIKNKK
ncbi:hypothetical protein OW763_10075 [Clostridium aestuarii]|uniref:Holin-like toxin n=1 Tax=Clostridium aestuarii TaxID=338193 RepID=A0ABT4D216_9CLOT|nr:hypothetical protein [Clostridium aestuarii]MCY6484687.1 hypothetical protein [Clostridium aestuarii]